MSDEFKEFWIQKSSLNSIVASDTPMKAINEAYEIFHTIEYRAVESLRAKVAELEAEIARLTGASVEHVKKEFS